jgi:hypothetical protein
VKKTVQRSFYKAKETTAGLLAIATATLSSFSKTGALNQSHRCHPFCENSLAKSGRPRAGGSCSGAINEVEFLPFDELLEFKYALAEYSLSGQAGAEADTIDTWLDEELHGIGDVFAVDKTGKRFVAHRMGKENVDWYKANRARLLAEAEKIEPPPMHGDQDGNQKKKGPETATIRAYEELGQELDPAKFSAKEREVSRKSDNLRRKTKD